VNNLNKKHEKQKEQLIKQHRQEVAELEKAMEKMEMDFKGKIQADKDANRKLIGTLRTIINKIGKQRRCSEFRGLEKSYFLHMDEQLIRLINKFKKELRPKNTENVMQPEVGCLAPGPVEIEVTAAVEIPDGALIEEKEELRDI